MMEYIRELLGLADDELDEAREWHDFWVTKIVVGIDLLMLVGFLLNLGGLMWVNLVFSWILATATIILATRPEGPAAAASLGVLSGATQEPQTIPQELKKFLKLYAQWSATALFWSSGILLALGTVSVEENPKAALVILATVIVIFSYVIAFIPTFVIARKALYAFACIMFVANLLSLVPWTDLIGTDVFGTRAEAVGVGAIEKAAEKARQQKNAKILKVMERKVAQGEGKPLNEILSPLELEKFEELRKERDERSLGKKFSQISWPSWPSRAEAEPAPPPPPPPAPVYLAAMPAPPPPPVVVPKPIERPEWEMCETTTDSYIPGPDKTREKCLPATVKLEKHDREITVTRHDGATTVFHGFATETEGVMEGNWSILAKNYDGNGKFHLEFDSDSTWEYARGWRILNGERADLILRRIILLRDHE